MSNAFYVAMKSNPSQTGIAIRCETQPVPVVDDKGQPTGALAYQGIVHVLWDDPELASPAPSFHSPTDLAHMGMVDDPDRDEEGEEGEELEEAEETEEVEGDEGGEGEDDSQG